MRYQKMEKWKPKGRESFDVCLDKDKMYVYGGISNKFLGDLNQLDLQTNL